VTIFPDDNKKYLSTSLLSPEPVKSDYLTPDVELVSLKAFKRVCHACCEMYECTQRVPQNALEDVAKAMRVDLSGGCER